MKFRAVFGFECAYALRRPVTWIYAAVLFGPSFLLVASNAAGGPGWPGHVNAPARLAEFSLFVGMLGMLVSAAFFGEAAIRDVQTGLDPLLFTAPLSKTEYLGGRFLATVAVNALALAAVPLGLMAATLAYWNPERFGPFQASAYLQPFLLFLLPNLVLAGATFFTIGTLARQVIPVYLGAVGLFIGYLLALNLGRTIANPMLSALADPLGASALLKVTGFWTTAERNAQLVGWPATLVWSRLAWLGVALALLALLFRLFQFAHAEGGRLPTRVTRARQRRERKTPRAIGTAALEPACLVPVPRVAGTFDLRARAFQTLAVARCSLVDIAHRRSFAVALLVTVGLVLLWGWNVGDSAFDTSTWPVTFLIAETVLSVRVGPIPLILVTVYAGELVWKDRDVGVMEITDACPVPEGAALAGRFLALLAVLAAFQAAFMAGGILLQALQGYYHFEPGLYVRILFGLNFANTALLAALAMTIHVLVNHKYLGHLVVLMAFAFTLGADQLGLRHHLLVYGTDPGWTYSDMNGFGPFIRPFLWFKLYWAAWALLLGVVAALFHVRGREPGLRRRVRQARARFAGPVVRTAGVALMLILALGGFIFYNTNVLNAYRTAAQAASPQAEYERRYKRYEGAPQPSIVDADLRVEIYPDQPAVDMRGTYRLVNRTGAALDAVHVFVDPKVEVRSIALERGARAMLADKQVGYRIYTLERVLEPGESLQLAFDLSYRPDGFPNNGIQTAVVDNGAYFDRRWMPIIGYQPVFELADSEARNHFGLAPRPPLPSHDAPDARRYRVGLRDDSNQVHASVIVGTPATQTAVMSGVLRRDWTENGRRYFHYDMDGSGFAGTVFSARYQVLDDRWRDVSLRVYHHPTHARVLDRIVRSMKASLAYYTTQFGAYPAHQLRIVEVPRYGGFGSAHLQTVAFTEDNFLSRVRDGEIDQPFFGTAHEIAHQWWPGQAIGAMAQGERFLSESLANYSAMMVTEKTFGPEVARRVYDFQMARYLGGRALQSREVPLLDVEDQSYIAYRKGAIAMYLLRERIGEDRVNTALRRYLEGQRGAGPPYRTSRDLYDELRAVTPDPLQSLLVDLFETVTLWDVKAEHAVVESTGTGEYRVTLDVVAKKMRADSVGRETEVPMDDLVEIGVFASSADTSLGNALYLEPQRMRSGRQTIRVVVPRPPTRAGIDPRRQLIDRQAADNLVDVEAARRRD